MTRQEKSDFKGRYFAALNKAFKVWHDQNPGNGEKNINPREIEAHPDTIDMIIESFDAVDAWSIVVDLIDNPALSKSAMAFYFLEYDTNGRATRNGQPFQP